MAEQYFDDPPSALGTINISNLTLDTSPEGTKKSSKLNFIPLSTPGILPDDISETLSENFNFTDESDFETEVSARLTPLSQRPLPAKPKPNAYSANISSNSTNNSIQVNSNNNSSSNNFIRTTSNYNLFYPAYNNSNTTTNTNAASGSAPLVQLSQSAIQALFASSNIPFRDMNFIYKNLDVKFIPSFSNYLNCSSIASSRDSYDSRSNFNRNNLANSNSTSFYQMRTAHHHSHNNLANLDNSLFNNASNPTNIPNNNNITNNNVLNTNNPAAFLQPDKDKLREGIILTNSSSSIEFSDTESGLPSLTPSTLQSSPTKIDEIIISSPDQFLNNSSSFVPIEPLNLHSNTDDSPLSLTNLSSSRSDSVNLNSNLNNYNIKSSCSSVSMQPNLSVLYKNVVDVGDNHLNFLSDVSHDKFKLANELMVSEQERLQSLIDNIPNSNAPPSTYLEPNLSSASLSNDKDTESLANRPVTLAAAKNYLNIALIISEIFQLRGTEHDAVQVLTVAFLELFNFLDSFQQVYFPIDEIKEEPLCIGKFLLDLALLDRVSMLMNILLGECDWQEDEVLTNNNNSSAPKLKMKSTGSTSTTSISSLHLELSSNRSVSNRDSTSSVNSTANSNNNSLRNSFSNTTKPNLVTLSSQINSAPQNPTNNNDSEEIFKGVENLSHFSLFSPSLYQFKDFQDLLHSIALLLHRVSVLLKILNRLGDSIISCEGALHLLEALHSADSSNDVYLSDLVMISGHAASIYAESSNLNEALNHDYNALKYSEELRSRKFTKLNI